MITIWGSVSLMNITGIVGDTTAMKIQSDFFPFDQGKEGSLVK
jgi:hypothetical protein